MARPTKYKQEYAEQGFKLALLGATDAQMADFFDVNVDSVYEWKKVYPEFSEALKNGKASADAEVAQKLYNRATGYDFEEKEDVMYKGEKHTLTKKKHLPPDVTAIIFWLKNRKADVWRDKQAVDITSDGQRISSPIINVHKPK